MILLINGPFGVGKTTIARLLTRKYRRAVLFDPEHVGLFLRLLGSPHSDFQDDPRWPGHVVRGARLLRVFTRVLVVPITLWRPERYDQVVQGLGELDSLISVRLSASEPELRKRIERGDAKAREWRLDHLQLCLDAFTGSRFGIEVPTDGLTPDEVATRVEALAR